MDNDVATDAASVIRSLRERARGPTKTVTTFGPEPYADLEPILAQFDADMTHEYLPIPEADGYLVVRDGEEYLGSTPAAALGELGEPSLSADWDAETRESAYRELVSLLSGAAFEMDNVGQLVATAREVEERAARTDRGRLYTTFQSLSAFRTQVDFYRRLAGSTDLEVAVFGRPDWEPPAIEGVTVYRDDAGDLTEFWVVAFDGGGDDDAKCALIAEETGPRSFIGVVTYDPDVVDELTSYLDGILGK